MLIDLVAIIALNKFVDGSLDLSKVIYLPAREHVARVVLPGPFNLCVDALLLHKITLEQTVVQFDLSEPLKVLVTLSTEISENALQKVCH